MFKMLEQKECLQFSHLTLGSWDHFSVSKLLMKKAEFCKRRENWSFQFTWNNVLHFWKILQVCFEWQTVTL